MTHHTTKGTNNSKIRSGESSKDKLTTEWNCKSLNRVGSDGGCSVQLGHDHLDSERGFGLQDLADHAVLDGRRGDLE